MLIGILLISSGIILIGFVVFKIADHLFRHYLGFNTVEHEPILIPAISPSESPFIVCVLGWGGSTRRQLRRLLEFYASHQISTISWINPMLDYFFGVDIRQVERILDLLLREQQTQIIIHAHSNNGALVWGHMVHIMKTNRRYASLLSKFVGVIFDSAPFTRLNSSSEWLLPSAIGASRACVSIVLNRGQYFHWWWSPFASFYLFVRFIHRRYLSPDPSTTTDKVRRLLNATPADIPQCYLYSDKDRLIAPQIIESFITTQTQRGVTVVSHRFVGSAHVNHFRSYPEEYSQQILDFLTQIQLCKQENFISDDRQNKK